MTRPADDGAISAPRKVTLEEHKMTTPQAPDAGLRKALEEREDAERTKAWALHREGKREDAPYHLGFAHGLKHAREALSAVPTVDVGSPDVLRFLGLADGIEAHASSVVQFPFLGRLTDDERIELGLSLKCAVLAYCEGCFGVDFGPDEPTPTPTDGADPLELDRMEEVARAASEARRDSGHCGEGTLELRERLQWRDATNRAFANTFDPLTVLRLVQMARGKS